MTIFTRHLAYFGCKINKNTVMQSMMAQNALKGVFILELIRKINKN